MYEQSALIISRVANGFVVRLPPPPPQIPFYENPESYGKVLSAITKGDKEANLGIEQDEVKPKKRPSLATDELSFVFTELQDAFDFMKFKLEH